MAQRNRVLIPINVKLNAFMLLLLSASIAFYVYYAVNLFESDKMAYVFESVKSQNAAVTDSLDSKIDRALLVVDSLSRVRLSSHGLQEMFESVPFLKAFVEAKNGAVTRSIHDQSLDESSLKNLFLASDIVTGENKVIHTRISDQEVVIVVQRKVAETFLGIFDVQYLLQDLETSRLYQYGLMETSSQSWMKSESLFTQDLYPQINEQVERIGVDAGTFILPIGGENWIVAFDKLQEASMIFTTLVQERKALEASAMLKHKSIFFGTFVLSIAILMGFLFSKIFTIPIKKLYEGSRNFAANNFTFRVKVASRDELGVLASSFNTMADDIESYMAQMEEKSRLENELRTAQLVQSSFFEGESLQKGPYQIFSFYRPASECGGDWWGCLEKDGKLIMIVVDATGHGTAAALMTAVIHNCQTALQYLMKLESKYLHSSAFIMDYLNQSVCNVKSDLMATAFVAIVDKNRSKLTYTNASHNPPLLLKFNADQMTKEDIVPLMENLGKRLGEDKGAQYEQVEVTLTANDKLLFYTDGLIEGENEQGKQWGKRKLLKVILQAQGKSSQEIVNEIVADAYEYFGPIPQADDICVIGVEMS